MSNRYPRSLLPYDTEVTAKYIQRTRLQSSNIDRIRESFPDVPIPNKIAMVRYTPKALNIVYQSNNPNRRSISDIRLGKKGS